MFQAPWHQSMSTEVYGTFIILYVCSGYWGSRKVSRSVQSFKPALHVSWIWQLVQTRYGMCQFLQFLATRTNHRAIAMMFIRPSVCLSIHPSVCDHRVHFGADLSLQLDSPMFWAPWHQSMSTYSQSSFSSSTWNRGRVWMCKLDLHVNTNIDK